MADNKVRLSCRGWILVIWRTKVQIIIFAQYEIGSEKIRRWMYESLLIWPVAFLIGEVGSLNKLTPICLQRICTRSLGFKICHYIYHKNSQGLFTGLMIWSSLQDTCNTWPKCHHLVQSGTCQTIHIQIVSISHYNSRTLCDPCVKM